MTIKSTGSCLCGAVKYTTSADFEMSGNCHCNTCKKITGGPFEAFAVIDEKSFDLSQGEDALIEYQISEKARKYFCGTCGTPIFNQHRSLPGKIVVHIGTLGDPQCVSPSFNLYCENMLPWVASIASLKSFDKGFVK